MLLFILIRVISLMAGTMVSDLAREMARTTKNLSIIFS